MHSAGNELERFTASGLFVNAPVERQAESRLATENEILVRKFWRGLTLGFGAAFEFADEGGVFFARQALL